MTKFAIFVDGSNLFGSMRNLNLHVNEYEKFYRFIFEQAVNVWKHSTISSNTDTRLLRVFWYEVGTLDEWDLDNQKSKEQLGEWFKNDNDLRKKYAALAGTKLQGGTPEAVAKEAWSICFNEGREWYLAKKRNVAKAKDFHFAVRAATDFIDIIPCGHLKIDLLNKVASEKGIDTFLAVDMVDMIDTYDVALVVTGDADSIPSIERVKRSGKQVGIVEFIKGHPPERKGRQTSSKLKAVADFVVPIYETDLQKHAVAETAPAR